MTRFGTSKRRLRSCSTYELDTARRVMSGESAHHIRLVEVLIQTVERNHQMRGGLMVARRSSSVWR